MGSFNAYYDGIGELMRSPGMQAMVYEKGKRVEAAAIAAAPIESGEYKASFSVTVGVIHRKTSRACATIRNSTPYAIYVEFGSEHNPRHRTLGKALDAAG